MRLPPQTNSIHDPLAHQSRCLLRARQRSVVLWIEDGIHLGARLLRTETAASSLTSVKLQATLCKVKIRSFAHKGLKKLYAEDSVFSTICKTQKNYVRFPPGKRTC